MSPRSSPEAINAAFRAGSQLSSSASSLCLLSKRVVNMIVGAGDHVYVCTYMRLE